MRSRYPAAIRTAVGGDADRVAEATAPTQSGYQGQASLRPDNVFSSAIPLRSVRRVAGCSVMREGRGERAEERRNERQAPWNQILAEVPYCSLTWASVRMFIGRGFGGEYWLLEVSLRLEWVCLVRRKCARTRPIMCCSGNWRWLETRSSFSKWAIRSSHRAGIPISSVFSARPRVVSPRVLAFGFEAFLKATAVLHRTMRLLDSSRRRGHARCP